MDELRHDVNEAFDNRQHELGDLKGVPERMLLTARAARGQRADNRLRLAAGLAAVVIVAVVIGTFAFVRAGILWPRVPAGSPKPGVSPTPTALTTPLNVPDSTPVILYQDPVRPMPRQFDGITWDGKFSGRVDWPVGAQVESLSEVNQSANLFAIVTKIDTKIMDRSGRVLATIPPGWFAWADDGQHLCLIIPGNPAALEVVAPGSPPRNVTRIQNTEATMQVAACSLQSDRAVVVQGAQYRVIQLSTGKVLWSHRFNVGSGSVVVSPDGQYIAEDAGGTTSATNPRTTNFQTTIVGPDGSTVAHMPVWVAAFSGDGSLVVTAAGNASEPVRVVRWRDGGIVWSAPDGFVLRWVAAEPGGTSIAIEAVALARLQPDYRGLHQGGLYVVASDGRVIAYTNTGFIGNYH